MSSSFAMLEDERYIPLVVIGSITSLLSMLGSGCILYMSSREAKESIMHRFLFGLSVCDLISSIASLFMPFMLPSSLGLPGATGNDATCSTAGFFLMTFIMVGCCYNAGLSLYFFLVVCRSWKERDFQGTGERLCHVFAWTVPLALNIAAVSMQAINPSPIINNVCTYATSPWNCNEDEKLECKGPGRGKVTAIVSLGSLFLIIFTLMSFVGTFFVWSSVKQTFQRSSIYRFQGSAAADERILQVRTQAILYSLVYFNTIAWPFMAAAIANRNIHTGEEIQELKLTPGGYAFQVLYFIFYPLQGFLNFFVYTRLRVQRLRKLEARPWWEIYKKVILSSSSEINTQRRATTRATHHVQTGITTSTQQLSQQESPPDDEQDEAEFYSERDGKEAQ